MELGNSALDTVHVSYTEGGGEEANVQVTYSGKMEMKGIMCSCAE